MKGIVMEINRSEAVILSDDGSFSRIKNKNYSIGQTVIFKQRKKGRIAALACTAAAALVITCGGFAYYTPTSYVSLDVNPSFAFSLNMFKRVVDVQAVNDDAKNVLNSLNLKNESIDDALEQTIDKLIEQGYITDTDGGILIAASESDPVSSQTLADQLKEKAQEVIAGQGKAADVEATAVDGKQVQEAKSLGVTPGKLALVKKLKESMPDQEIDVNEWLNKPVKEIDQAISQNGNAQSSKGKEGNTNSTTSEEKTGQSSNGNVNPTENRNSNNDGNNNNGANNDQSSQGEQPHNSDMQSNGNDNKKDIQDQINNKGSAASNGNKGNMATTTMVVTTTTTAKTSSSGDLKQNGKSYGKINGHGN